MMSSKVAFDSQTVRNSPQVMDRNSTPNTKRQSMANSPRSPPLNDSHLYAEDSVCRPYLPECWTDTKRMTALMGPFRAREANPEGWDLKMNFWINCIAKWSLQTHSVVFRAEDVMKAFERGSKRPDVQCIQLVVSHLKRGKNVVNLTEMKTSSETNVNKNWLNWSFSTFVVKPLTIGLSLVSSGKEEAVCEDILPEVSADSKFVLNETLQVMSEEMMKYLNQLEDIDCIRFDNLFNKCKNRLDIDLETFEVIVNYLENSNKLKVFSDNGIKIVKIGKNSAISESDIGFIRLETAKELLENEIERLETEIESIRAEAKTCVSNKNKEKAIVLLKRKKRVENKLVQKVSQLDNVDVLIDQLINSSSHNTIFQAFQKANDALKLANSNQEDMESTMADVEETLDVMNEMVADVSRPLVADAGIADIEEELDDLLTELNDQTANEEKSRQQKKNEKELVDILDNLSVNDQSLTETRDTLPEKEVPLPAL
ncbi:unnamed protein product [Medioppia subpectinata]|uniref:Charged multivesicular body protein 7 n=1 Tax=Medioppia subpectinata TaxID=1979941 RepID=A0A7R9L1T2_9ACAR|nr:unnamed protein product [Medioppia subpectinata]CAG2113920.1 unnamed protein product [Medioppia subpectinata]